MDQQRLNDYQNRVADWIGEQGVLFQLRHAGTIGGSTLGRKLGSLFFSIVVAGLVLAAIGYVLLIRHFKTPTYSNRLLEDVKVALAAEEYEGAGFERASGKGMFKDLSVTGGEESFFFKGRMKIFSAPLNFFDGVTKDWKPESIKIKKADFEIKAGGEESMKRAFAGVLSTLDGSKITRIEVSKASFDWGYSKLTYGRVEDSQMDAKLVNGKWEISLRGGTFQQNWLEGLSIVEGDLVVYEKGIEVSSLKLALGPGTLDLSGWVVGSPVKPEFDFSGTFEKLPLEELIKLPGIRIRDYMSGLISGDIQIEGSPDRVVTTKGSVTLGEGDLVTFREKWGLLRALSVLDKHRTYRRVDFHQGSFDFRTSGGSLTISNLVLNAREKGKALIEFSGSVKTRLPSQKEAAKAIGITLTDGFRDGFRDATDSSASQALEDERISLNKAAGGGKKKSDFGINFESRDEGLYKTGGKQWRPEDIEAQRLKAEMNVHRVEGELMVRVPGNAFEEYPGLEDLYPLSPEGLRLMEMEVDGTFLTVSEKQADTLFKESRVKSPVAGP